jgi:hypothetical protein
MATFNLDGRNKKKGDLKHQREIKSSVTKLSLLLISRFPLPSLSNINDADECAQEPFCTKIIK